MQIPELSIILPVYNVEPYIERCLLSLEKQDIPTQAYEIICINDGSPDHSRDIILQMAERFSNIRLIEQENKGVSSARNKGIENARGEYLIFIDPDDYVIENRFSSILTTANKNNADVCFLGFTFLDEKGNIQNETSYSSLQSCVFKGTDAYFLSRGNGKCDPDRLWAILIRRSLMTQHSLKYLSNVPYLEDGELVTRILALAEKCVFDPQSFYQRTSRPGSATHSRLFYSQAATDGFIRSAIHLRDFKRNEKLDQIQIDFLDQPILKFVLLSLSSSMENRVTKKLKDTIRKLRKEGFKKINARHCHAHYRLYGNLFNLSPYMAAMVLFLVPRMGMVSGKLIKTISWTNE
jgi:glycosyltransferase involved in cell wall biosynthesis